MMRVSKFTVVNWLIVVLVVILAWSALKFTKVDAASVTGYNVSANPYYDVMSTSQTQKIYFKNHNTSYDAQVSVQLQYLSPYTGQWVNYRAPYFSSRMSKNGGTANISIPPTTNVATYRALIYVYRFDLSTPGTYGDYSSLKGSFYTSTYLVK